MLPGIMGSIGGLGSPANGAPLGPIGEYRDTDFSDTNANNYTFTAMDIGAEDADRIVVLVLLWRLTSTDRNPINITIGGVAASLVAKTHAASGHGVGIWQAAVPTGTTANIVIGNTSDGGVLLACRALTYRVVPSNAVALDSGANSGTSNPLTVADIAVESGGWLVCAAISTNNTASAASYNGVDTPAEDLNTLMEAALTMVVWSANTTETASSNDPGTTSAQTRRVVAASWV